MAEASVTFAVGSEQATVVLDVEFSSEVPQLSGNIAGVLGDAHIVGDLNLTDNVYSEGHLTGVDTFHVQGNGFTWFFQNGGSAELHGKVKARWGEWGCDTTGWVVGDRLAVAGTKAGIYVPSEMVWSNWSAARPVNSPNVTLIDGTVRKPEVVNLSQTIVFENLARGFHIHDSGGVQHLSDVKFLNCGSPGVGNYSHHFHMVGENARGSILERVVVEGSKNHAFVAHGSHGVSYPGCVAYNGIAEPFWWDPPTPVIPIANNSNDINWDDTLAMWTKPVSTSQDSALTAYMLGTGVGNTCRRAVAANTQGISDSSGFQWPESGNQKPNEWVMEDCLAHNNRAKGIFVWQNDVKPHPVVRFTAYRLGGSGIKNGAYLNRYNYQDVVVSEAGQWAFELWAPATNTTNPPAVPVIVEGLKSDRLIQIARHHQPSTIYTIFRECDVPGVTYEEVVTPGVPTLNPSHVRYEDCGLVPADFTLTLVHPDSIIEIWEAGVMAHRWAGSWA